MRSFVAAGFALLAFALGAACGGSDPATSVTPPTSAADGGDAAATVAGYKPLISGLIDKGSEASYHALQPYPVTDPASNGDTLAASSPAFGGLVVNQTWLQLEPSEGSFDFTVLDASLAAVETYNAAHPDAPLGVRLRVFGAYAAPAWAKMLDGGPIATSDSGTPATVGHWWGPTYRMAWAALQTALAARYDDDATLREVAVSSCAASTAEPMVIDTDTLNAAQSAGYTTDQEHDCLTGAFTDYAGWKRTALYFPLNSVAGDSTIAPDILQHCASSASAGGPLCILANNALDADVTDSSSRLAPLYAAIGAAAQANPTTPIAFQMNGPDPSTWCGAIAVAVDHHARSVELWPNGFASLPTATLESWSQGLMAGTEPTCD